MNQPNISQLNYIPYSDGTEIRQPNEDEDSRAVVESMGTPGSHLLGDKYFSMAAIRYGDYIAKISLSPKSDNVAALHGKEMDAELMKKEPDTFLAAIVREFVRDQTAVYELSAQLCTDLEKRPVEDGSVQWPEDEAPINRLPS